MTNTVEVLLLDKIEQYVKSDKIVTQIALSSPLFERLNRPGKESFVLKYNSENNVQIHYSPDPCESHISFKSAKYPDQGETTTVIVWTQEKYDQIFEGELQSNAR